MLVEIGERFLARFPSILGCFPPCLSLHVCYGPTGFIVGGNGREIEAH
jgi:hypothetical protein